MSGRRARIGRRAAAAAFGLMADRVVGEPPSRVHPVRAFGAMMRAFERRRWQPSKTAGVVHAGTGVALATIAGAAVRSTTVGTCLAVAGRELAQTARSVQSCLADRDLEQARLLVPALVGRDLAGADEKELARAVVESVAENTVDAVVAPAFWAACAGAPGAFAYRAVNTMDAMVGHRSARHERYGWASARLDDAAGWVPARLTAVLVATVRPRAALPVWRAARSQAPAHPSPNAGVAEAAFAAALGLRLGGLNHYGDRTELRPALGDGRPPQPGDIEEAVRLSDDVGRALAGLLLLTAAIAGRSGRRP